MLTNVILDYERGCKRLGPAVWGEKSFRNFAKVQKSSSEFAACQNRYVPLVGGGVAGDHFERLNE